MSKVSVIKLENETIPPPLVVGISYNLKKGIASDVGDIEAEYDSYDTIEAISNVFSAHGAKVVALEADSNFVEKLKNAQVDIVFNIAEGTYGRGRESQVPAILNFLRVPFSGSDETTMGLSLDKALTKRYLSTFQIDTPAYFVVNSHSYNNNLNLKFPLIVKPNCEGSGKGISDFAVVENQEQLNELIEKNLINYGQPMLVEEYIKGREFTVGILGNGHDMHVFEPMEICYLGDNNENMIYSYNVKINYKKYIEYKCPSALDNETAERMKDIAAKIYTALDCKDFSRIDFRLSEDGVIYFIEINPLPGLAPGYSDYPMLAQFCGMDYQTLILNVLNSATKRYGIKPLESRRF